ncbi:YbgA family protein [Aliivibrio wodanis]|uniref:YbgA family protein n=1 Tax=Aliivibrio wodanis TaxID=80852 RepID=UPI00406D491A
MDIQVGISSCVNGASVRFDGGHKSNKFTSKVLAPYFTYVPICPEVGSGMSVPRPTIRLITNEERIALVDSKDASLDYTDSMVEFSQKTVNRLKETEMCGYIVCANSPSCGMERVKVYSKNSATKNGVGLYTQILMKEMPWLPVEEDGRLSDPVLKENFITRVFCLNDLYKSMGGEPTAGKIIAFHSRYKYTLMSHSTVGYKNLGKLVAKVAEYDINEFFAIYRTQLMQTMAIRASRKNNTNVLMHLQGYFKKELESPQKVELAQIIQDYNQGLLPLLSPITLIKHHLGIHSNEYLAKQSFLNPYPQELRLRYGL